MSNFWKDLPKPFTVLAPMDDVTDDVFRHVVLKAARPDVFFTEFTNADGLSHGGHGVPLRKLKFTPNQHPIVAQIWGNNAKNMAIATKIVKDLGFDGVDINMGCPVHEVVKKGAGAGLIGKYKEVEELLDAVRSEAGQMAVSVKTRLGINTNVAKEWCTFLLEQNLSVLTLHARTAKEMSKVPARWEEFGSLVEIKNKISPETLIVGNGDIKSYAQVTELHSKYNIDGAMIGRGIFDNPWVFQKEQIQYSNSHYFELLKYHVALFKETWGDQKNFSILKKFFKMYIKDFKGANALRQSLMETKNISEVEQIIQTLV